MAEPLYTFFQILFDLFDFNWFVKSIVYVVRVEMFHGRQQVALKLVSS